jgi:hypothetical protein
LQFNFIYITIFFIMEYWVGSEFHFNFNYFPRESLNYDVDKGSKDTNENNCGGCCIYLLQSYLKS